MHEPHIGVVRAATTPEQSQCNRKTQRHCFCGLKHHVHVPAIFRLVCAGDAPANVAAIFSCTSRAYEEETPNRETEKIRDGCQACADRAMYQRLAEGKGFHLWRHCSCGRLVGRGKTGGSRASNGAW